MNKRRRSQTIRKYRRKIKTSFQVAFGQDATGTLLCAAKHIKTLRKVIGSSIEELDPRSSSKKYSLDEIIWTVIIMFFLREGSRNNMNRLRLSQPFSFAFQKIFGIRIPHLDTCNGVLEQIDPSDLKTALSATVAYLIEQKLFDSSRNFKRVSVVFDGTGIGAVEVDDSTFIQKPQATKSIEAQLPLGLFPQEKMSNIPLLKNNKIDVNVPIWATGKKSKNGVIHFSRNLLLLRMIGPNGLSIIVDWEAINTEDGSEKEDCEQNAAKRLLERFKGNFKRLQITIVADGLYANKTFIELAEDLGFKYIFTLKNDSLKTLWKEIEAIKNGAEKNHPERLIKPDFGSFQEELQVPNINKTIDVVFRDYEWVNGLNYAEFSLSWCSLCEYTANDEKFYFSVITNLVPDTSNINEIMRMIRERSIIEDGFNTLKNRGFGLKHKYSRVSDFAAMNYITLMSVADILSNLLFSNDWVQRTYFSFDEKYSICSLIKDMKSKLLLSTIEKNIGLMKQFIPKKTAYSRPILS